MFAVFLIFISGFLLQVYRYKTNFYIDLIYQSFAHLRMQETCMSDSVSILHTNRILKKSSENLDGFNSFFLSYITEKYQIAVAKFASLFCYLFWEKNKE